MATERCERRQLCHFSIRAMRVMYWRQSTSPWNSARWRTSGACWSRASAIIARRACRAATTAGGRLCTGWAVPTATGEITAPALASVSVPWTATVPSLSRSMRTG